MAQDKKPKSKVKIVLIILGVVGVVAILYVGVGLTTQGMRQQQAQEATAKWHTAAAEAVQASLDHYYVLYGSYPSTIDTLLADIRENKNGYWPTEVDPQALQDSLAALKDLDYSKRGDSRAYRITYTDVNGKQVVLEGNYQADYQ